MNERTLVVGDIQGNFTALVQCLERSKFDSDKDRLIVLGDVCDGYPETKECIELLSKIPDCILVIGNHDLWTLEWMTQERRDVWATQGGEATFLSYVPAEHIYFLRTGLPYLFDKEKKFLFVHGGFDPNRPLVGQGTDILTWDRTLYRQANRRHHKEPDFKFGTPDHGNYEKIFIGHTTTQSIGGTLPLKRCNVWMMDTGAGWTGKLTIMDVDTEEYWQSDLAPELYPDSQQAHHLKLRGVRPSNS